MTECQFCRVTHKVTVPTVHLNGTSPEDLFDDLDAAVAAVENAIDRLRAASPNGRDYYVQDAGTIQRVQAQHELRMDNLRAVERELEEMRDHVQAVMDFEAARRRRAS